MRMWILFQIVLSLVVVFAGLVVAQELTEPLPGSSGTIYGTVREITKEYIRVEVPGDIGRRYYFPWVEKPGAATRPAPAASVDQTVAVKWSYDDRRRLESIAPSTLPAVVKPVAAVDAPPAYATHSHSNVPEPVPAGSDASVKSASDTVNVMIDGMLATGERLVALPLAMLLPAFAMIAGLATLAARRMFKPLRAFNVFRMLLAVESVVLIFAVLVLIDRKFTLLEDALNDLRTRGTAGAASTLHNASQADSSRKDYFFSLPQVEQSLTRQFGTLSLKPTLYDQATDVVQVQMNQPLIKAFIAIIDLKHPGVEVQVGGDFTQKTLTSDFAKQNRSTIAINGEAGQSPGLYSGLGSFRGTMVSRGVSKLTELQGNPRPNLMFSTASIAKYLAASDADRAVDSNAFNVIWGRTDAIVKGVVQGDSRDRQPRTAMGINQDGTKLFLMVVDGRQPRYSNGFTRNEVGQFLKAFGAYNAMLCDEGGSSCMYVRDLGGIINIPSDNQGRERPTYTHFGITLR